MLNIKKGSWNKIEKLKSGHKINPANLLFAKIDMKQLSSITKTKFNLNTVKVFEIAIKNLL